MAVCVLDNEVHVSCMPILAGEQKYCKLGNRSPLTPYRRGETLKPRQWHTSTMMIPRIGAKINRKVNGVAAALASAAILSVPFLAGDI